MSHRPLPTKHTIKHNREYPRSQRDSNSRSQQSSGHRPKRQIARLRRSASHSYYLWYTRRISDCKSRWCGERYITRLLGCWRIPSWSNWGTISVCLRGIRKTTKNLSQEGVIPKVIKTGIYQIQCYNLWLHQHARCRRCTDRHRMIGSRHSLGDTALREGERETCSAWRSFRIRYFIMRTA
jgi:hypothetical protein